MLWVANLWRLRNQGFIKDHECKNHPNDGGMTGEHSYQFSFTLCWQEVLVNHERTNCSKLVALFSMCRVRQIYSRLWKYFTLEMNWTSLTFIGEVICVLWHTELVLIFSLLSHPLENHFWSDYTRTLSPTAWYCFPSSSPGSSSLGQ